MSPFFGKEIYYPPSPPPFSSQPTDGELYYSCTFSVWFRAFEKLLLLLMLKKKNQIQHFEDQNTVQEKNDKLIAWSGFAVIPVN